MQEIRYWILGILSPSFVMGYKTNLEIFTSKEQALERKLNLQLSDINIKCDIKGDLSKEQLQNFVEQTEEIDNFCKMILKAEQIAENKKRQIEANYGK
jgi:uncharacterized OsmC-like protein